MNGSMALALQCEERDPMDQDWVGYFAQVEKELKEARRAVLKAHNLTENDWKSIKELAVGQLGQETAEVEGVTVYTVPNPIYSHKNSTLIGETRRIHIKEDR